MEVKLQAKEEQVWGSVFYFSEFYFRPSAFSQHGFLFIFLWFGELLSVVLS